MRKNAIETFTVSTLRRTGGQGVSVEPFESGEHAFSLPTLTVDPPREASLHLTTIAATGAPLAAAGVYGNHAGPDAQRFATKPVVSLGIIGRIAQQPANRKVVHGLTDSGPEVGGIVTRPGASPGGPDQMRIVLADDGKFGPGPVAFGAAPATQEVPADIMACQAGGVDAGLGLRLQQARGLGNAENGLEQSIESPFFRSRCSA